MRQGTPKTTAPASVVACESSAGPRKTDWGLVRHALADGRSRFRSVEAIAVATGLRREQVEETLECHCGEVRAIFARSPSFCGVRRVYTLRSTPRTLREIAVDVCAFASR